MYINNVRIDNCYNNKSQCLNIMVSTIVVMITLSIYRICKHNLSYVDYDQYKPIKISCRVILIFLLFTNYSHDNDYLLNLKPVRPLAQ